MCRLLPRAHGAPARTAAGPLLRAAEPAARTALPKARCVRRSNRSANGRAGVPATVRCHDSRNNATALVTSLRNPRLSPTWTLPRPTGSPRLWTPIYRRCLPTRRGSWPDTASSISLTTLSSLEPSARGNLRQAHREMIVTLGTALEQAAKPYWNSLSRGS